MGFFKESDCSRQDARRRRYAGSENKFEAQENFNDSRIPQFEFIACGGPALIPFDQCKGIGNGKTAKLLRAILDANRTGKPFFPPKSVVPTPKKFEFFVDYEFFQNLNFDCQTQWPTLHGCSMIFMAGVGYEENGGFKCSQFIAETESPEAELKLLTDFVSFIEQKTGGACCDGSQTAFYHWSPAEDWQSEKAADTHKFPAGHTLRRLPWNDLRKIFLDGPAALPGCLNSSTLRKHWANLIRNTTPRGRKNWRRD